MANERLRNKRSPPRSASSERKNGIVGGAFGTVISTHDGGATWTKHNLAWNTIIPEVVRESGHIEPNLNSVHFANTRVGWLGWRVRLIIAAAAYVQFSLNFITKPNDDAVGVFKSISFLPSPPFAQIRLDGRHPRVYIAGASMNYVWQQAGGAEKREGPLGNFVWADGRSRGSLTAESLKRFRHREAEHTEERKFRTINLRELCASAVKYFFESGAMFA